MFAGTALSVRPLVYAGLSLFIMCGPYVNMVVCVVYVYNLAEGDKDKEKETKQNDDGNAEKEEKVCFVQMLFTGMFFFLKLVTS